MSIIIFYEKPGCINNGKQKNILKTAGYSLVERDILLERWESPELRKYFGSLPVVQWFNQSAPDVKNKKLTISELTEEEVLSLMVEKPILIRRPLIRLGDIRIVGFNVEILDKLIDLKEQYTYLDMETCPRSMH